MIEVLIAQLACILSLAAVLVLMVIYGYREFKYRKKIEFLTHLVDKGYETNNVDINNL